MAIDRIVMVYNAESGFFNGLADYGHRVFSPTTYPCPLCALTHGNLGMRREWRSYIKKLDTPVTFLQRDAFRAQYAKQLSQEFPDGMRFPVVLAIKDKKLVVLVDAEELALCKTLGDLKDLLTERMLARG